jgi:hypothetical protein
VAPRRPTSENLSKRRGRITTCPDHCPCCYVVRVSAAFDRQSPDRRSTSRCRKGFDRCRPPPFLKCFRQALPAANQSESFQASQGCGYDCQPYPGPCCARVSGASGCDWAKDEQTPAARNAREVQEVSCGFPKVHAGVTKTPRSGRTSPMPSKPSSERIFIRPSCFPLPFISCSPLYPSSERRTWV